MAKKKIEDFGEEIFGARKHLAQLNRELRATDIGDWTDAEREQNLSLIHILQTRTVKDWAMLIPCSTTRTMSI